MIEASTHVHDSQSDAADRLALAPLPKRKALLALHNERVLGSRSPWRWTREVNSAVRFLYQLKRSLAVAGLGVAFTGCVGELHHARQPKPLLAPRPRFAEFTHPPRLAREQFVGLAGFVGEDDFSQSSALKALLAANGIESARSCSLGCAIAVRRDDAAAAAAIVAADGRFVENLAPEFMLPLASGPR